MKRYSAAREIVIGVMGLAFMVTAVYGVVQWLTEL
jgi:hypothetical protein